MSQDSTIVRDEEWLRDWSIFVAAHIVRGHSSKASILLADELMSAWEYRRGQVLDPKHPAHIRCSNCKSWTPSPEVPNLGTCVPTKTEVYDDDYCADFYGGPDEH